MKVKDIILHKEFTLAQPSNQLEHVIHNVFASDLMSHAMGHADHNDLFITVLNNINVLGVASLLEFSAVIFAHGVQPNKEILDKAKELDIPILLTKETTVECIKLLSSME